ncbi:exodeoxyribonuclease VII small subunit [Collinsella ureilytica]|nr:exodeoxyribonuclease VII small subunit [Collinsella urealyticum]
MATEETQVDMKKIDEMSYREASQELERIIRNLESGELELEESLEGYSRGVELLKSLRERLADAEQKVSVLVKDVDGADVLEPAQAADEDDSLSF